MCTILEIDGFKLIITLWITKFELDTDESDLRQVQTSSNVVAMTIEWFLLF